MYQKEDTIEPSLFESKEIAEKKIKREKTNAPLTTSFSVPFYFTDSGRRNQVLICEGRKYIQNNKYGDKIYYKCSNWHSGCKARAITLQTQPDCIIRRNQHNHDFKEEAVDTAASE
mgnify:FL=1